MQQQRLPAQQRRLQRLRLLSQQRRLQHLSLLSPRRLQDELARAVVAQGVIPLLVLCLDEPELPLKRIAACTLSDIAKHDAQLAQKVVDASALDSFKLQVDGNGAWVGRELVVEEKDSGSYLYFYF